MTKNLWPTFDSMDNIKSPKEILEEQGKFLSSNTGGKLYGEVEEVTDIDTFLESDHLAEDFAYRFVIKSRFLDNYKFVVFSFYHDITMYPVRINLDNVIGEELEIIDTYYNINDEIDFTRFLSKVLKSKRMKTVISSLIRLSK